MKTLRSATAVQKDIRSFIERSVDLLTININELAQSLTPVRTGRARAGWKVIRKFKLGSERNIIENRVPYIGILDGVVPARGGKRRGPIIKPAVDRAVYMTRRSNR